MANIRTHLVGLALEYAASYADALIQEANCRAQKLEGAGDLWAVKAEVLKNVHQDLTDILNATVGLTNNAEIL